MSRKEEIENYKSQISEIVQSKDIIEGIHNYCDRWCEKCTHTKHCSVFKIEQLVSSEGDTGINDMKNVKFWDKLSLVFEATYSMIAEDAENLGINLDEIKTEPNKYEINKTDTEKLATEYGIKIMNWFQENSNLLTEKAKTLEIIDNEELLSFTDAIEVIQWYSLFISAKVHRANFSAILDEDDDEFEREDRKGSAKIALIAIKRSIEAFSLLYEQLKEKEDEMLDFLVLLTKIKKQVEIKYPKAWQFKRPGFDD